MKILKAAAKILPLLLAIGVIAGLLIVTGIKRAAHTPV
jgi:hypothetical protein